MRNIQRIRSLATTPMTFTAANTYIGQVGELVSVFDDNNGEAVALRIHDGNTVGGLLYYQINSYVAPENTGTSTDLVSDNSGTSNNEGIYSGWLNDNVIDYSAYFSGNDFLQSKSSISATTFTISMWVKGNGDVYDYLFKSGSDVGLNWIQSNGQFYMHAGNNTGDTYSPAKYRDFSSWYHVVLQSDGGNAKYIINNSYESNTLSSFNLSGSFNIGSYNPASAGNFEGHMANIVLITGEVLEPSHFAEIVEGNWIHKKLADDQNYGDGFYLNFADESDLGKDVSGNDNDFTVGTV